MVPSLEEFLKKRDFTGAMSLLEFTRNSGKPKLETDMWIAYCAFHLGNYKRAMEEYETILKDKKAPQVGVSVCCQYPPGCFNIVCLVYS